MRWCGNFTTTYNDFASATEVMATVIRGTGVFDIKEKRASQEFDAGDGCESNAGFMTTLVQTFDETVEADMDTIRGLQGDVEVLFATSGKTVTFPGTAAIPNFQYVDLVDGKVEITTICHWPIGTTEAEMFQTSV